MQRKKRRIIWFLVPTIACACSAYCQQFEAGNRIDVKVVARVLKAESMYRYLYSVTNGDTARQSIRNFNVIPGTLSEISRVVSPADWRGASLNRGYLDIAWVARAHYPDSSGLRAAIRPSSSLGGFEIVATSLPAPVTFYAEGRHPFPHFDEGMATDSIPGYSDLTPYGPGVVGTTVGPVPVPDPLEPGSFLDSISSYAQRSEALGWIKSQAVRDKYLGYLSSAKSAINQNNVVAARAALQLVLRDVDIDSSSAITSECYALLLHNTNYLLGKLPSPPPLITVLTPASAIVGSGAFTLSISGSYFVSGSVATWKGDARTTTFVSESQLLASIPATDIAAVDSPLVGVKNPDGSQSNAVRFRIIKTVSMLLDDLRAQLSQLLIKGLIGDANFVKELDNGLENAKKHLVRGDSVNCYKEISTFQDKVNKEYLKTVDDEKKGKARDKRFVTVEGWKLLYYGAQEIMDRLPGGKKK